MTDRPHPRPAHEGRRYDEDEVARIFDEAAREHAATAEPKGERSTGLTLRELQDIATDVGLDPDRVAKAAMALDAVPRPEPRRRVLGVPVGVGRTIDLPAALGEEEWDHLVVALRDTFDARGKISHEGRFRHWSNGNLQALLEPDGVGERLRLRTVSSRLRGLLRLGTTGFLMAFVMSMLALFTSAASATELLPGMMVLLGVGVWGVGSALLRSFPWARTREAQMEGIARRALELSEKRLSRGALGSSDEQSAQALPPGAPQAGTDTTP